MPQLPFLGCHAGGQAEAPRLEAASVGQGRRPDLHRLPQGHRPPPRFTSCWKTRTIPTTASPMPCPGGRAVAAASTTAEDAAAERREDGRAHGRQRRADAEERRPRQKPRTVAPPARKLHDRRDSGEPQPQERSGRRGRLVGGRRPQGHALLPRPGLHRVGPEGQRPRRRPGGDQDRRPLRRMPCRRRGRHGRAHRLRREGRDHGQSRQAGRPSRPTFRPPTTTRTSTSESPGPTGEHTPVPFVEGGKMDPENEVKLAVMLIAEENEFATQVGCWATCHHDSRYMPDHPDPANDSGGVAGERWRPRTASPSTCRKAAARSRSSGSDGKPRGGWDKLLSAGGGRGAHMDGQHLRRPGALQERQRCGRERLSSAGAPGDSERRRRGQRQAAASPTARLDGRSGRFHYGWRRRRHRP